MGVKYFFYRYPRQFELFVIGYPRDSHVSYARFKDVRAKIFQSTDFFLNFYCSQITSYLCQKYKKKNRGSPTSFQS